MNNIPPDILAGRVTDDMTFADKARAICAPLPRGSIATYGQIATALGNPHAARAVGRAMVTNPYAPDVPCHRVVGSDGKLTGYGGKNGTDQKSQMLIDEGVVVTEGIADLTRVCDLD